MVQIKNNEGMKVQGFMKIELVNEKTGSTQIFQNNTVTNLGKMLFLASGPGLQLMQPSQIDRGMLYSDSPFTKAPSGYSGSSGMKIDNVDRGLHVYLVNSASALTADAKFVPIYEADGDIDPNKLVGYAGFRRTPTSPKEGVIDRVLDDYMNEDMAVVQRWRFDPTQANGTFNKLCIGAGIHNTPGNGFAFSKGINIADIPTFGGVDRLESSYMRPGVTNFTSSEEILLSLAPLSDEPTANAVYNLATGKLTQLASSDPRYGAPLGNAWTPQVFYNNKLYFVDKNNRLKVFDVNTKTITILDFCYGGLWAENNILYFTKNSSLIKRYNMDSGSWGTDINLSSQTFTTKWFKSTNASEALYDCSVGKLADGKYLIVPRNSNYGPRYNIVVTDINNIEATIVGFRPNVKSASEYVVNGVNYNIWGEVSHDFGFTGIAGFSEYGYERARHSLKFSKNWFGNLISFVELTSPITKTENDVLYVSYGYKFT